MRVKLDLTETELALIEQWRMINETPEDFMRRALNELVRREQDRAAGRARRTMGWLASEWEQPVLPMGPRVYRPTKGDPDGSESQVP